MLAATATILSPLQATLGVLASESTEKISPNNGPIAGNQEVQIDASLIRSSAKKLISGERVTTLLTDQGQVYIWGYDTGIKDPNDPAISETYDHPVELEYLRDKKIISIYSDRYDTTYALTQTGEVYVWGLGSFGELGLGDDQSQAITPTLISGLTGITQMFVAGEFQPSIYALSSSGEIYAWGDNQYGQLGLGDEDGRSTPTKITLPAGVSFESMGTSEGSGGSVFAVDADGKLYGWGNNDSGQLGLGDTTSRTIPTQISVPNNDKIKSVTVSSNWGISTYAISTTGNVYSFGSNFYQMLGLGDAYAGQDQVTSPVKITTLADKEVKKINVGVESVAAILSSGDVYAWGNNSSGQLGIGQNDWSEYGTPTKTLINEPISQLISITDRTHQSTKLALSESGDLYIWGANANGIAGTLVTDWNISTPQKAALPNNRKFSIIPDESNAGSSGSNPTPIFVQDTESNLCVFGDTTAMYIGYSSGLGLLQPEDIILSGDVNVIPTFISNLDIIEVYFGNERATSFSVTSDGDIIAVTPSHPAGVVDVKLVFSNGSEKTLQASYEYVEDITPGVPNTGGK
ncbi:MAG: RCC1 domain-containing protein [Candidatus Saccharimonadales bacterium]